MKKGAVDYAKSTGNVAIGTCRQLRAGLASANEGNQFGNELLRCGDLLHHKSFTSSNGGNGNLSSNVQDFSTLKPPSLGSYLPRVRFSEMAATNEGKKKRKLAELENDSVKATTHPQKSRVAKKGHGAVQFNNHPPSPSNSVETLAFKVTPTVGQSRQAKSERRSKTAQSAKAKATDEQVDLKSDQAIDIHTNSDQAPIRRSKKQKTSTIDSNASHNPKGTLAVDSDLQKGRSEASQKPTKPKVAASTPKDTNLNEKPKKDRFILFIGNLPYTATTAQIQSYFAKLAPQVIRHSTDKATGRSKGFAFLEFQAYDKMKTCLKLYHHSIFSPEDHGHDVTESADKGSDKRGGGRRINVELTAGGGGGKSEKRKEKIRGKNRKLEEERERMKEKETGERGKGEGEKKGKVTPTGANAAADETAKIDKRGDIHPSRRSRVA